MTNESQNSRTESKTARCYQCERDIDTTDDTQWCMAKLVDEFNEWLTNEDGEELFVPICLECGRELGASTVATMRLRCEEAERKEIQ